MIADKIMLLGFEEGSIAYLIETSLETSQFDSFNIILNTKDIPEEPLIVVDESMISIIHEDQYNFGDYVNTPVHFGVLHAHIKYVLYRHFHFHHEIDIERYHSFAHPLSYFPKSSTHQTGFYIGQLSAVSSFSKFGFGVTIKKSCSIGHHCHFGDFVTINPGSIIAGYSNIGEGTEIGTGSVISNNITIGKHCLIGAGSVVTKDIPDGVVAYGSPCKVVRKNERWQKAEKLTKEF